MVRAQIHPKWHPNCTQFDPKLLLNASRDPSGEVSEKRQQTSPKYEGSRTCKPGPFSDCSISRKFIKFWVRSRTPSGGHFRTPRADRGSLGGPPGPVSTPKRSNFNLDFRGFPLLFPAPTLKTRECAPDTLWPCFHEGRDLPFWPPKRGPEAPPGLQKSHPERLGDGRERARTPGSLRSAI